MRDVLLSDINIFVGCEVVESDGTHFVNFEPSASQLKTEYIKCFDI